MKKVIVLGANGHTAREIITRLLEQDDVELTLFARQATRLADLKGERVRVVAEIGTPIGGTTDASAALSAWCGPASLGSGSFSASSSPARLKASWPS